MIERARLGDMDKGQRTTVVLAVTIAILTYVASILAMTFANGTPEDWTLRYLLWPLVAGLGLPFSFAFALPLMGLAGATAGLAAFKQTRALFLVFLVAFCIVWVFFCWSVAETVP